MSKKVAVEALVPEKKDAEGNVIQKQLGPVQVLVDYGETGAESIQMFGDEAMNTNAFANWRVTIQAGIRSALKRGETPEAIIARFGAAKMGVAQHGTKIDPMQAYLAAFSSATPEKQAEMLAELQRRAQVPNDEVEQGADVE